MNPPKPETECCFHAVFFVFMTSLGGIAAWHELTVWAAFCFIAGFASLALLFSAASAVEEDEDAEPPVGK